VQRINKLLAQLREQQDEGPASLELNSLLPELLAPYRKQTPAPTFETDGESLRVRATNHLGAAIGHVLQNAIDAAGAVPDSTGRGPAVRVSLQRNGRWGEVHVEDNGAGMDAEFIETRLFQPFTSTKGVAGMGIGAYQARTYVRALGGDISVTSEPGRGSHFVIRIPLERHHD
jgi:signal transduction histidine kinase